jgi:hypothetical protein
MMEVLGPIFNHSRFPRAIQLGFDIVKPDDAVNLGRVKRTILEGHTVWIVQTFR